MNLRIANLSGGLCLAKCLCVASFLCLTAQPRAVAAPYTGWASDYTGNEPGTLALWKFDDPSPGADASGNGWDLTYQSIGTQTGVPGKFGQAYYSVPPVSTANDSYTQTAVEGSVLFNASQMSVDFWFKPAFDTLSGNVYLVDKMRNTSTGLMLRINPAGSLIFSVGNGTAVSTLTSDLITWDAANWYNIALTYQNVEGDGVLKIFLNGNLVGQQVAADFGDLDAGAQRWRLGNRLVSAYASAPGYYDNFRIADIAYDYAPVPEVTTAGYMLFGGLFVAGLWGRRALLRQSSLGN